MSTLSDLLCSVPSDAGRTLLVRALSLYRGGQADRAALVVRRLMAELPGCGARRSDRAEVLNSLGQAVHALGQPEAAVACYRQALAILPDHAESHNNLGAAYQGFGHLEAAESHYRRALALKPDCTAAWINLHSCLYRFSTLEPAAKCLERAVTLNPEAPTSRFLLGCIRDHQGRIGEAADQFQALAGTPIGDWGLECWHFLKSLPGGCPQLFGNTSQGLRLALEAARCEGLVLEFGVRFGTSIRQIAALADQSVHGFDTFHGLPDSWLGLAAGTYSTAGERPAVPASVQLHAGLFADSLPPFLARYPGPIRFINVDCDLYQSTRTVLDLCAPRVSVGTVLLFDEYLAHPGWHEDEHRALTEVAARCGWRCDYLAVSVFSKQAIVIIR